MFFFFSDFYVGEAIAFNHSQLPNILIRAIINRLPSVFFDGHHLHFYAASRRTPLPIRLHSAFIEPKHISLWQRDGYGGYVVTVWLPPFWAYPHQVPAFLPPVWAPQQRPAAPAWAYHPYGAPPAPAQPHYKGPPAPSPPQPEAQPPPLRRRVVPGRRVQPRPEPNARPEANEGPEGLVNGYLSSSNGSFRRSSRRSSWRNSGSGSQ